MIAIKQPSAVLVHAPSAGEDFRVVPNSHVLQSLGISGTLPDTALLPHSSEHLIFINRPTGVQFLSLSKIADECLLTVVTGDELI